MIIDRDDFYRALRDAYELGVSSCGRSIFSELKGHEISVETANKIGAILEKVLEGNSIIDDLYNYKRGVTK